MIHFFVLVLYDKQTTKQTVNISFLINKYLARKLVCLVSHLKPLAVGANKKQKLYGAPWRGSS